MSIIFIRGFANIRSLRPLVSASNNHLIQLTKCQHQDSTRSDLEAKASNELKIENPNASAPQITSNLY